MTLRVRRARATTASCSTARSRTTHSRRCERVRAELERDWRSREQLTTAHTVIDETRSRRCERAELSRCAGGGRLAARRRGAAATAHAGRGVRGLPADGAAWPGGADCREGRGEAVQLTFATQCHFRVEYVRTPRCPSVTLCKGHVAGKDRGEGDWCCTCSDGRLGAGSPANAPPLGNRRVTVSRPARPCP